MIWALAILFCAIAAAGAIWAFRATRSQFPSTFVRILYACAAVSAAAALLAGAASVAGAAASEQNARRLAPVIGMTRHVPLYSAVSGDAASAWTDGPLAAILLAPSSLSRQAATQIIIAVCLNFLVVLAPVFWLLWRIAGPGGRVMVWPCMALLLWWTTSLPSLNGATFVIGADGLAIGLIVISIALLTDRRDMPRLILSAACMALACWTKISILPLICLPVIYLAFVEDWSTAGLFALLFFGAACLAGSILIPMFGIRGMWLHMVSLPLAQPWTNLAGQPVSGIEKLAALGGALLSLVHETRVPLCVLAAMLVLGQLVSARPARSTLKTWLSTNAWTMLPASAVVLVHSALIGFLELGRDPASFGLFGIFIAMTVGAVAIRIYRNAKTADDEQAGQIVVASICILLIWESIGVIFTAGGAPALLEILRNALASK